MRISFDGRSVDVRSQRTAHIIALLLEYERLIEAFDKGRLEVNFAGKSVTASLTQHLQQRST